MSQVQQEVVLAGGNVNSVVRVGDTVRRETTAASPTIHRLLDHLEVAGFTEAPRFLGLDEQGREILTFLDGETGIPETIWQSDEPLIAAAKLLRQFHDAVSQFKRSDDDTWNMVYPDAARHEVICHNDFAPYNFVFADGLPSAVIDFDLVGPGPRLKDVAYAAYWMTPLSFNSDDQVAYAEGDVKNGSRRCRLFCDAYGIDIGPQLFDMIDEVLAMMGDEQQMLDVLGFDVTTRLKADGHLAHWRRERDAFQRNRLRIERNLTQRRKGRKAMRA